MRSTAGTSPLVVRRGPLPQECLSTLSERSVRGCRRGRPRSVTPLADVRCSESHETALILTTGASRAVTREPLTSGKRPGSASLAGHAGPESVPWVPTALKAARKPDNHSLVAHNNGPDRAWGRARTGVLCVEHHEHICADMARSAALACRRSVRAFGAGCRSTDRQLGRASIRLLGV
jgi:hypothetical protein